MSDVIVIGAGGHGKVVADIIIKSGDNLLGFLDDAKACGEPFFGSKILGKVQDFNKFLKCKFIVAIGDNKIREEISRSNMDFYTAIHPKAVIGTGALIGKNTAIMANAVINSDAVIGDGVIINTGAVVEHDCKIGSFSHISPKATVCGTVNIGRRTWIGAGAVIRNNVSISDDVLIGAGGIVVKNVSVSGVYVGNPAKKI